MATSEMNYTGKFRGLKLKALNSLCTSLILNASLQVWLICFKMYSQIFTAGGKIFMNLIFAALLSGIKAPPSSPCLCWDFMPRMCSLSFICHAASCEPFKHLPLALPFCCDHTICDWTGSVTNMHLRRSWPTAAYMLILSHWVVGWCMMWRACTVGQKSV